VSYKIVPNRKYSPAEDVVMQFVSAGFTGAAAVVIWPNPDGTPNVSTGAVGITQAQLADELIAIAARLREARS
jgi:hypothetical protein